MAQALEKCENCLKDFPESKIATHFGYCRRNIKKCGQCGEMYDINCQEEHEEEFHKKANCQFCKKEFGLAELDKHKNTCSQRTKYCEYCQLNVPLNQFPTHLKACQSRTKTCDQCKKPIANKDYLVHLTTCRGIVQEPKSYDQYINNQRSRDPREDFRQPIKKVESRPEERKEPDYRRRQVPTTGGISNYVASKEKPNIPSVQVPSRSQPTTNGISGNNNKESAYSYVYSNATYNPRQGYPYNQPKEQPREQPVPVRTGPSYRNQIKTEVQPGFKKQDQNNYSYGTNINSNSNSYQPPTGYRPTDYTKKQTTTLTKPTISPISSNPGYGAKNESQKPSNVPTTTYNYNPKKEPTMKKQQKAFDPHEYGGYSDEIPQELLRRDLKAPTQGIDEQDEELQKVLMESMNQNKRTLPKNMPKQFSNEQLMNSSFYQDIDEAKQRAAYEQMQKNARKNRR